MECYHSFKESKFIMYLDAKKFMVEQWVSIYHIVDLNG